MVTLKLYQPVLLFQLFFHLWVVFEGAAGLHGELINAPVEDVLLEN